MSRYMQSGEFDEALRKQTLEQEGVFQLIASLANCLDRNIVIETLQHILGIEGVERDECVHFDDIAIGFGEDGRVNSMYRVIGETIKPTASGLNN